MDAEVLLPAVGIVHMDLRLRVTESEFLAESLAIGQKIKTPEAQQFSLTQIGFLVWTKC